MTPHSLLFTLSLRLIKKRLHKSLPGGTTGVEFSLLGIVPGMLNVWINIQLVYYSSSLTDWQTKKFVFEKCFFFIIQTRENNLRHKLRQLKGRWHSKSRDHWPKHVYLVLRVLSLGRNLMAKSTKISIGTSSTHIPSFHSEDQIAKMHSTQSTLHSWLQGSKNAWASTRMHEPQRLTSSSTTAALAAAAFASRRG